MNLKLKFSLNSILVLCSLLLISGSLSAQDVDFSGKWKLNPEKSKLNAEFSMAPQALMIVQAANSLTMERQSEFQGQEFKSTTKLTLDGAECTNTGMMDIQIKSTAVWSDDKTSLTVKTKVPWESSVISITDVYKTAGPTLTIETTSSSDWGTMTETYVFDKVTE